MADNDDAVIVNVIPPASKVVTVVPPSRPTPATVVAGVGQGGAVGPAGPPGPVEMIAIFTRQNEVSPLVGTSRYYFERNQVIYRLRASVGTPPQGSPLVVTAYINGVSIGSVSIPAGSNTTYLPLSFPVHLDDYLTVSIIAVGSVYSGADLTVTFNIT